MTTKPKDKTAPSRKAQERQRKREAGLRPIEVWVPASMTAAQVRAMVDKLVAGSGAQR